MSRSTKKENLLFCIVSTLISTFGILLILKSNGFYPFKEVTLFTFDMKEQYLPFFSSLHYLIGGDDSIFFHCLNPSAAIILVCMPTILQALFPG